MAKKKNELTPEDVFNDYKELGLKSQIAVFKLIEEDLKAQHNLRKLEYESLEEVVSGTPQFNN